MTWTFVIIFSTVAALGATVLWAFTWAIRTGQFEDFQRGATSIFDADEPLGQMTDRFPDANPANHELTDQELQ